MKRQERPVYAFCRRGDSLVPELAHDLHALDGIAQGERVKVEIKQWRSLPRLRAYWLMLQEVVDATDCAPNAERLHDAIKLETGHVDLVRVGHHTVAIPRSISFAKMTEAEMVAFFRTAEAFVARHYGWVREDDDLDDDPSISIAVHTKRGALWPAGNGGD